MQKHILFILFVILVFLSFCSEHTKTVLRVGTSKLDSLEFHRQYQMYVLSYRGKSIKSFVDYLIAELILKEYAQAKGWNESEENIRLREYVKNISRRNRFFEKKILDSVKVNDRDIRTYYQLLNTEFKLKHLVFSDRKTAWDTYTRLQRGADWNVLASKLFTDPRLKNNGGALGWTMWSELDPGIADQIKDLPLKVISRPIRSAYGFHIFKIENIRYNPIRPEYDFRVHRKKMKKRLINFKKRIRADAYINVLKKKFDVKIKRNGLQAFYKLRQKWPNDLLYKKFNTDQSGDKKGIRKDFKKIQEIPLVSSKKGNMTIGDFMRKYLLLPKQFRIPLTNKRVIIQAISKLFMENILDSLAIQDAVDPAQDVNYKINLLNAEFKVYKAKLVAELKKKIKVDEKIAQKYYQNNRTKYNYPDSVRYSLYRFKNKSDAEKYGSLGNKNIKPVRVENHKQWIGLTPGVPFGGYLKTMEVGTFSAPIQTTQGAVILYIFGRKAGRRKPFELVKQQVIADAVQQQRKERFLHWLSEQRSTTKLYIDWDWIHAHY